MLSRAFILAITVLALLASVDVLTGEQRIAIISIHQARSMEPSTITVFVRVAPAKENHGYYVLAQCRRDDGLSTSHFQQLEGAASAGPFAPAVFRLSGCQYDVAAVLVGDQDRELARSARRTVRVLCRSCPDEEEDEP